MLVSVFHDKHPSTCISTCNECLTELLTQEAGVKAHGIHGDLVPFPQVEHFQQVLSR